MDYTRGSPGQEKSLRPGLAVEIDCIGNNDDLEFAWFDNRSQVPRLMAQ